MAGHWPQLCEVFTRSGPGLDWAGGQGRAAESEGEAGLTVWLVQEVNIQKTAEAFRATQDSFRALERGERPCLSCSPSPSWSRPPAPIHQGLDPLGTGTDTEKTHRLLHLFHKAAVLDRGRPEKQKHLVGMGVRGPGAGLGVESLLRPLPARAGIGGHSPGSARTKKGQGCYSQPSPSSQGSGWPCPTSSPHRLPRPQTGARKSLQKRSPALPATPPHTFSGKALSTGSQGASSPSLHRPRLRPQAPLPVRALGPQGPAPFSMARSGDLHLAPSRQQDHCRPTLSLPATGLLPPFHFSSFSLPPWPRPVESSKDAQ